MAEFSYSHGALLTVRLDVPLCLLYEVQAQSTAYATFPGLRQSYLSVTPPAWVSVSTALKPTLTTFMFWLTGPPTHMPIEFVRAAKQASTYEAYRSCHRWVLEDVYKKTVLWSSGYFVATTGQANTETIRKYIENQG